MRWLLVLVAGLIATPALATERIGNFVSDVTVQRNGDLAVVETIDVTVEGDQIRHGIFRDFPTTYEDRRGATVVVGFSVESVELDGRPESFGLEGIKNGERIRIGSADRLVPYGPHRYVIRYSTTRQIGFFADFDELYWNATGNDWQFPIDRAEARITLPDAVPFGNVAFYTGRQGATGHDAEIVERQPGRIAIATTRPLDAREGLTVAVAWPKGVVSPPSAGRRARWFLKDNLGSFAALIGSVIGLLYFAHAWNRVGRDPKHGTMVPLFSPPAGLTAAATRYIAEMSFDNRAFTAAILDLGVHRRLKLADSGSDVIVSEQAGGEPLAAPEDEAADALFRGKKTVPLVQAEHQRMQAAQQALSRGLAKAYAGTVFHWNGGWLALGIAITLIAYALTAVGIVTGMGGERGSGLLFGLAFTSGAGIAAGIALNNRGSGMSLFRRVLGWLFLGIFAAVFGVIGLVGFVGSMRSAFDALPLLLPLLLLPVMVSAFSWMRSPTVEGQKLRDAIAGFRQYLGVAEEKRLEFMHPPEKTPELFERYLPYAVALNVENAWAARFAEVLAAAGASAAVAHWYVTSANRDPVALVDRLGSSLSHTVAAASTAPGSSSGSGGGGSSGGGGGGGGGGGW